MQNAGAFVDGEAPAAVLLYVADLLQIMAQGVDSCVRAFRHAEGINAAAGMKLSKYAGQETEQEHGGRLACTEDGCLELE